MSISGTDQIISLAAWTGFLMIIQITTVPLMRKVSRDYAVPLAFPVSLLLITLISWYLVAAGVPAAALLLFILIPLGYAVWKGMLTSGDIRDGKGWYLIFLGTFFLALLAKIFYDPAIDISYEKFMDSMILSSMIHTPVIPPADAWYAGGTLSWYYYLAAWIFAVPAVLLSIPAPVMYNLAIPTVFAAAAVMIHACSTQLLDRFRYLPLFLLCISYPGFLTLIPVALEDGTRLRYILDGTVRLILPGSVTENPLAALLIGSPRPYAVSLFIQSLILFLLVYGYLHWKGMTPAERTGTALLLALGTGTLIPVHSFDFLIYAPLVLLTGFLLSARISAESRESGDGGRAWDHFSRYVSGLIRGMQSPSGFLSDGPASSLLLLGVMVPVLSLLVYLPFLAGLENQRMQGFIFSPAASDPVPFLLVHGLFLGILLFVLWRDIVKRPSLLLLPVLVALFGFLAAAITLIPVLYLIARKFSRIEEIFAVSGLLCILFCEFFVMIQNGTPDHPNTTYKFYFVSWVLLGVSTLVMSGRLLGSVPALAEGSRSSLVSLVLIATALFFPAILLSSGPLWPPTLDGSAYTGSYVSQDEREALDYLSTLPPGDMIVEGIITTGYDENDAGKYFSRVSSLTGIPAVIGSYSREEVFRGGEAVRERGTDVMRIYTRPEESASIMKKYGATLLYLGSPELSLYGIRDPGIFGRYGFTRVFHMNQTAIWRAPISPQP